MTSNAFSSKFPNARFVPGLELAAGFFRDAVQPMLGEHLPNLRYSAALIGGGSEVLGFDSEISTDHDWGPRAMLFVSSADHDSAMSTIRAMAMEHLPLTYRDYPTRIYSPDRRDIVSRHTMKPGESGLEPRIDVLTIEGFVQSHLGIDPGASITKTDWLTIPQHRFCSFVSGKIFHDDLGLQQARDRFRWYPDDVWFYLMASCWFRIGTDDAMIGRAGSAGDELGSQIIALRLVRDIMRLAFLMERSYAPYAKWLGSAFNQLYCADKLRPQLEYVANAGDWQERDRALVAAYATMAQMHNQLELTDPMPTEPKPRWQRPFHCIGGDAFAQALVDRIVDDSIQALSDRWLIGNIDLLSDGHALDDDVAKRHLLLPLYS
ncbi:MAG: DUF4037 domain-containing protein [Candidatus Latescibacteria bacterium]|nr:DUF4037 domain-containing protein [Candidatus Latescibacterota bacterium]